MVVNWPEIGIQTALIVGLLALVAVYMKYRGVPKLRAQAGEWAGAAIGRFWQKLTEEAESEAEGGGAARAPGMIKLGGFEMDVGTIKELLQIAPQLFQLARTFGLVSGGGGGGGENPFLK